MYWFFRILVLYLVFIIENCIGIIWYSRIEKPLNQGGYNTP
jgi:hypothetical protein|nr:MAG TPA: hypothetical protein [Caudoviricetes sp.]